MSIVENRHNKNELLVRSRVKGDIEKIFPDAEVIENNDADYLFRAFLPRGQVSEAIKKEVDMIDYDNFKDSVLLNFLLGKPDATAIIRLVSFIIELASEYFSTAK